MGLLCVLVGAGFAWYAIWARRGRSERARTWMANGRRTDSRDVRMSVLGAPAAAGFFMVGGLGMLVGGRLLTIAGLLMVGFSLLVLVAWPMTFIPIPDWVYPRWARSSRSQRSSGDGEDQVDDR